MPFPIIPTELLLRIAWFILKCDTCHCHHLTYNLSSLCLTNRHLRVILTPELHRAASPFHILFWGIHHSHHHTVTLALRYGADPNIPVREQHHLPRNIFHIIHGTAVEIAIRTLLHPSTTTTNDENIAILTSLLNAGGKPTFTSLRLLASYGAASILVLCLQHIPGFSERAVPYQDTLLKIAGANGHLPVVTLLISIGAAVNSIGSLDNPRYFPPLWTLCSSPLPVLQLLLAAGADVGWEHDGVSIVEHLLMTRPDVVENVEFLVKNGSRRPEREVVVVAEMMPAVEHVPRVEELVVQHNYHGWFLPSTGTWERWGAGCDITRLEGGCGCKVCPISVTGGLCEVTAAGEEKGPGL